MITGTVLLWKPNDLGDSSKNRSETETAGRQAVTAPALPAGEPRFHAANSGRDAYHCHLQGGTTT